MLIGMQLRRDADYSGGTVLCGGTLCSSVKIVKAEAFFKQQASMTTSTHAQAGALTSDEAPDPIVQAQGATAE